ncbi:helix-turn-helix domain-containing protein [Pluralibacter gergoviae]|uniref:helix-turn-helix domain-containing protein n=1 Tax=Pluralibacter gergoviae TaxID=61647 RepID=UPI003EE3FB05
MMKAMEISMYRISRLLTEKGWSQAELARRVGVAQQTVQQWVHGKATPKPSSLDKLVEVTGYPVHWFMLPPDDDQLSAPVPVKMSNTERELLLTFGAFPEEDQMQMLQEMKDKKESMDKTVERWLAAQKGRRA